ncbi:hypothetical protein SAMN04487934_10134 [Eubacterium ruminantium]|nr:hypothetical protein SAMN04487934_10134 [Eubacterium ruminantium]
MKNCPICGAQLNDTDTICNVCGAQQQPAQQGYDAYQQNMNQAQQTYGGYQDQAQQGYNAYQQNMNQAQQAYGGYQDQAQQAYAGFQQGAQNMQDAYNNGAAQYQQDYGQYQQGFDQYGQGQFGGGAPAPAPKSNKKMIIIIASVVGVIGLGVLAYFLFFRGGVSHGSAKDVAQSFVDALGDYDADDLVACMAPKVQEKYKGQLDTYMGMFKAMDAKVSGSVVSETPITGSDLEDLNEDLQSRYGFTVTEASNVKMKMTIKASFMGQSMDETDDADLVCGKVDGKWYVLDPDM